MLLVPVPRHVRAQSAVDHVGDAFATSLGNAFHLVSQSSGDADRQMGRLPGSWPGHVRSVEPQTRPVQPGPVDVCTRTWVKWPHRNAVGAVSTTSSHRHQPRPVAFIRQDVTTGHNLRRVCHMAPTITRARPVHAGHMHVAYELISQHGQLPAPTSVTVSTRDGIGVAIELTVNTASDVDAWAEAMRVEVEHELHRDGTWTDRAHGMLTAQTRAPYEREHIVVHVYSPQTPAHPQPIPHPHIDAKGRPQPCTHLELCAADEAEFMGEVH